MPPGLRGGRCGWSRSQSAIQVAAISEVARLPDVGCWEVWCVKWVHQAGMGAGLRPGPRPRRIAKLKRPGGGQRDTEEDEHVSKTASLTPPGDQPALPASSSSSGPPRADSLRRVSSQSARLTELGVPIASTYCDPSTRAQPPRAARWRSRKHISRVHAANYGVWCPQVAVN